MAATHLHRPLLMPVAVRAELAQAHTQSCNLTIILAAAQEYYRYMYMLLFTGLHT
jgi:hypothetical protein